MHVCSSSPVRERCTGGRHRYSLLVVLRALAVASATICTLCAPGGTDVHTDSSAPKDNALRSSNEHDHAPAVHGRQGASTR
ncbi:hypothetical protein C8F04DRAFT_1144729 [Mycena alexandri]|uniref:Uncharacterized protein n=1 Tax=Mycena alexandri TaxID=1745969 RepID=A0AAD6S708_9AGAR|nr:hypothetical protein C8F04DRAFT_1144729 [Mycena alexandri]